MTPRGAVSVSGGRDPQIKWEEEADSSDHTGQKESINLLELLCPLQQLATALYALQINLTLMPPLKKYV